MNAHVLDINTMPSFYHDARAFPRWFLRERSATIRTALDIIEETGWRKARDLRATGAAAGA